MCVPTFDEISRTNLKLKASKALFEEQYAPTGRSVIVVQLQYEGIESWLKTRSNAHADTVSSRQICLQQHIWFIFGGERRGIAIWARIDIAMTGARRRRTGRLLSLASARWREAGRQKTHCKGLLNVCKNTQFRLIASV
jgi:hypothetical protein